MAASGRGPTVLVPPGDSAVSQYLEVVPTAGGPGVPRGPGKAGGTLTSDQRSAYERLGAEGRTLVSVVDATSPPAPGPGATAGPAPRAGAGARGARADAASALVASSLAGRRVPSIEHLLLDAASGGGGGGLGVWLPALLALSAFCVAGVAVGRRLKRPS